MTLEKYLQQKIDALAAAIASEAPMDSCPECNLCEGHLVYVKNVDENAFWYQCKACGTRWSAERLEIDPYGKFLLVEWAD